MKINLSKQDFNSLIQLLGQKEMNMDVSTMYLYYLTNEANSITPRDISILSKKRKISEDKAFYYSFIDILELDDKDEEYKMVNSKCHISNIKLLSQDKYINNPYYQTIMVPEVKEKAWYFKYDTIEAYEGFMYQDLKINTQDNYAEISSLGFFSKPYKYLSVSQGEDIWMCVTPHEMETMEDSIKEASGNVLVYGLGLGYFPFMVSSKNNVNKITIIEKDKNVIDLFKTYILPQFPNKDKIEIIEADAFTYTANNNIAKEYDYAFVDLWHNVDDGISLYLEMKKLTKNNTKTKYSYWIEQSLLVYLRRLLLTLIDEVADNATEDNYKQEENIDDHIINRMYQLYKDKNITTFKEIYEMCSDNNLKAIAEQI